LIFFIPDLFLLFSYSGAPHPATALLYLLHPFPATTLPIIMATNVM
jgi:hypothetical protein